MEQGTRLLVLGGCRSGKSAFAERFVEERYEERLYIATMRPGTDQELIRRVAEHRARRTGWGLVEEPLELGAVLERNARPGRAVLLDCVTLWLANLLEAGFDDDQIKRRIEEVALLLPGLPGLVVLVANEVGLGGIHHAELSRRFADLAGFANQRLAERCGVVVMVVAGLPLVLKGGL